MNYKKFLAGTLAVCMTASLVACGDSTSDTTTASTDSGNDSAETTAEGVVTTEATEWTGDAVEVETEGYQKLDVDIDGQTMKWLGIYDLNPTNDSPERSVELALFEDTYGASIRDLRLEVGFSIFCSIRCLRLEVGFSILYLPSSKSYRCAASSLLTAFSTNLFKLISCAAAKIAASLCSSGEMRTLKQPL